MTDQDRREKATENALSGVAAPPVAQADSQAQVNNLGAAAQFTPQAQPVAPAEAQDQPAPEAQDEESMAEPVELLTPAEAEAVDAPAVVSDGSVDPVTVVAESADGVDASDADATPDATPEMIAAADNAPSDEEETAMAAAFARAEAVETEEVPASADLEAGAEPAVASDATVEAPGASFTPVEDEKDAARPPRRLKDLEVGTELEGRVTSIALYGVFVDIGVGRDGLVHISEMSDTRIDSPSDLVQINDIVKVRVKGIDLDARRISLTMRSPRERTESRGGGRNRPKRAEVDRGALSNLKVGDIVEGTITGMAPFGAFADIGVGKDGLIHISELSEGRVDKPEDAVQVGERHTFKLLEVDPEGTRISLSLRRAQRAQKLQQLETGQILDGSVSGLAPFGAFVDIGVGRDGLVHISELAEGRVDKVEDVVKIGDKVTVRVLEVDPQSKRISLTMRLEDRPAEPAPAPEAPPEERRPKSRGSRPPTPEPQPAAETYSAGDETDEEFSGNATLEDLLTKFGGSSTKRKDKGRRRQDEEEEDEDDRFTRRQREAHRRTLQRVGNDE